MNKLFLVFFLLTLPIHSSYSEIIKKTSHILTPEANCGNELRIKTEDGNTFQGKFVANNNETLILRYRFDSVHVISKTDINSAFKITRRTGNGLLAGLVFGTLTGGIAAAVWYDNREDGSYPFFNEENKDIPIKNIVTFVLGGTLVGTIIGFFIGHSTQRLGPIELDALPDCSEFQDNSVPRRLKLTYSF